jgi:hypothetical protein
LDGPDRAGAPEAARLAEDRLGNQLARVVAHCEQLAEDPTLPEEARERARSAMRAAFEAAESLRALLRVAGKADPAGKP